MNRILKIIGEIRAIAKVIKKVLGFINWFLNYKVRHAAWAKHLIRRSLVKPFDSRYGYNFIAMLKLLKKVMLAPKAVGDADYCEDNFQQEMIQTRANDTGWCCSDENTCVWSRGWLTQQHQ